MNSEIDPGRTGETFSLGSLVATSNAMSMLLPEDIRSALRRHANGDWGDLDTEDRLANEQALLQGERLFSAYNSATGVRFYVITEWDRSVTTVLLPEDY
jgi:hypothetical protein